MAGMPSTPHDHRLPIALPYRDDLTSAVAALINLVTNPTFQREITAAASDKADYTALQVLRTMSFTRLRRPSALASETGLARSQVSKALDRLDAAGLVTRERNEDDGRGVGVEFTDEGRSVAQALYDVGDEFFAEVVGEWAKEDVNNLTVLVSRFVKDARDVVERLHAKS